jgi:hypothetical protein
MAFGVAGNFSHSRDFEGMVVTFDDVAGIGTIALADSTTFGFHCTQIADGTRYIPRGAVATFRLLAVNLGVVEAIDVRQIRSLS